MDFGYEYVEYTSKESTTSTAPGNFTIKPPAHSPGTVIFNKYVIFGVPIFLLSLLLVAILVHLLKSRFASHDSSLLYSQVASDADTSSLDGSDDDMDQELYTSCQLHVVDDDELIAAGGFEKGNSSLDGGLSVTERKVLINVLRKMVARDRKC